MGNTDDMELRSQTQEVGQGHLLLWSSPEDLAEGQLAAVISSTPLHIHPRPTNLI